MKSDEAYQALRAGCGVGQAVVIDAFVRALLAESQPTAAVAEGPSPIPMVLHCPECRTRHIDEGEFATKVHHTHSCQGCGLTWRPAVVPTVGVQFLPGFKNERSALGEATRGADEWRQLYEHEVDRRETAEESLRCANHRNGELDGECDRLAGRLNELEAILREQAESQPTAAVAEGPAAGVEQWEHHWSSDADDAYCIHCSANRASRYGKCLSFELHEWEAYGLDEMMCKRCGRIIAGDKPWPVKFQCVPASAPKGQAAGEASELLPADVSEAHIRWLEGGAVGLAPSAHRTERPRRNAARPERRRFGALFSRRRLPHVRTQKGPAMSARARIHELSERRCKAAGIPDYHTVEIQDVIEYLDEQEQSSHAAKGYAHHTPGCEFDQSHGLDCACFEPKTIEAFYDAMESMTMHCLDKEPHLFRVDNEITIRFGDERAKAEQHGGGRAGSRERRVVTNRPAPGLACECSHHEHAHGGAGCGAKPARHFALDGWPDSLVLCDACCADDIRSAEPMHSGDAPSKSPAPDADGGSVKLVPRSADGQRGFQDGMLQACRLLGYDEENTSLEVLVEFILGEVGRHVATLESFNALEKDSAEALRASEASYKAFLEVQNDIRDQMYEVLECDGHRQWLDDIIPRAIQVMRQNRESAEALTQIRAALCNLADVAFDTGETALEVVELIARDRRHAGEALGRAEAYRDVARRTISDMLEAFTTNPEEYADDPVGHMLGISQKLREARERAEKAEARLAACESAARWLDDYGSAVRLDPDGFTAEGARQYATQALHAILDELPAKGDGGWNVPDRPKTGGEG